VSTVVIEAGEEDPGHAHRELAALEAIGCLASESEDLGEILSFALDKVSEILEVEIAYLSSIDPKAGELRPLAFGTGCQEFSRQTSEVELCRELAERVARTERSVVEDMLVDRRLAGRSAEEPQLGSYAGFPIKSRGRVLGVISVASGEPRRFTSADLAFLSALAGQLGGALENSLLYEQLDSSQSRLRERVKEIRALYDVTREALTAPDIDAFLSFVTQRLPASMQHQGADAVIWCIVGDKGHLAWSDNVDRKMAEKLSVVPGEGYVGERIARREPVIEYELQAANRFGTESGVSSLIAVPISVDDEVMGSVAVFYPNDEWRFLEEEKQLLYGISEQIAQFIARDAITRESRQRAQEISTLFEVSKALASVVELEDLLPVIEDTLVETLRPAEAGALLLFDEGTGMLTVESAFGYDINPLRRISLQVGESISGKVFESGRPRVWVTPEEAARGMANMTEHNRVFFRQASGGVDYPNSAIGVPLEYREGKIGVVTLETLRSENGLSVSDLPFLQALAELIVVNVDKIWLLRQTEQTKAVEEANRLKSELIAALAHDMRTPLASIKGYASALLLNDVQWGDEARAEHLRIIDEEANELQTMIQDLLESSIIDAGLLQIEKEPILMPRLVEQIIGEMNRRTAKHQFVTSFGADFPIVSADPRRIMQVLRNLLDNAIKYSPDGGLVVVRGQVTDKEVIISVADEGIGLSPEHLNRLFEKFFRLKSPLGQQVRGSGLGLPVSRTIVENHGGRIWAESELGKGTTIYFSLPRDGEPSSADED
jgi:K+-sensing histidine kinase KdpD